MRLIAPTVSAVSDVEFKVVAEPIGLSADALAASETVTVQYKAQDSAAWAVVGATLTATEPQVTFKLKGTYRASKGLTASACGVYAMRSAVK